MSTAAYGTVADLAPDSTGHNLVLRVHAVEVVVERRQRRSPAFGAFGGGSHGGGGEGGGQGISRERCSDEMDEMDEMDAMLRIAEVVCGDATGAVVMSLRGPQIDLAVPGAALVVRNARVDMFRGFMRLRVDKWGKLAAHPDGVASTPAAPTEVRLENNVSMAQYAFFPAATASH